MTKFEEVKNITNEEYFRGNRFSIDAFNKKYIAFPDETYPVAVKRVCDYIASVEKTPELRRYWAERWFDEIYNDWWQPAGSIMQGAGCGKKVSLANCTTISLGVISNDEEWDNLESIIKNAAYTVAKAAAYRQGLGVDFNRIRPKMMKVLNSSNESSGAIHWMKFMDSIGYYVGQKGRIPAMLFSLGIKHCDVEDFITVKGDKTTIQNANISVQVTDDFYQAVEKGEKWHLSFDIPGVKKGQKVYVDVNSATMDSLKDENGRYYFVSEHDRPAEHMTKEVDAKKLLWLLAENMFENAEPGIQNIDTARRLSNSDYVYDPADEYDSRILSTNACSEQYLSRESLCVLASINAGKFSASDEAAAEEIAKIGPSINRFLDNVNECELVYATYATPHQRMAIEKLRRTGAGSTNWGEFLFKRNLMYGSQEGNSAIEEFNMVYNYHMYKNSIALGHEKGSFKLFDKKKFTKSPFVKRMMSMFDLEFDAMRNVTCSSIAPTGTLSLMFRDLVLSYGIEPAFGMYYWKRTRISGSYEYYFCVPRVVRAELEKNGFRLPMESDTIKDTWDGKHGKKIADLIDQKAKEIGLKFVNSTEVSPFDKLDLMSKVMEGCDSSISVTYMFPEDTKTKKVYDFIIEAHKRGIKSIAAFPDKKMYGIVSFIPFQDLAVKLTDEGVEIHRQNFTDDEYQFLKFSKNIVDERITKTNAPKRPKVLPCDIHRITYKGGKYYVVVGLMGDDPYEVFVGLDEGQDSLGIEPKMKTGTVTKIKRGLYNVSAGDVSKQITGLAHHEDVDAITRLTSASLRHGADVSYVVQSLEKTEGSIVSFAKVLARCLKKYIPEGAPLTGIERLPGCERDDCQLVRSEGCVTCITCSNSRCS